MISTLKYFYEFLQIKKKIKSCVDEIVESEKTKIKLYKLLNENKLDAIDYLLELPESIYLSEKNLTLLERCAYIMKGKYTLQKIDEKKETLTKRSTE